MRWVKSLAMGTAFLLTLSGLALAIVDQFAGNFTVPEHQSGFYQEAYEVKIGQKLQRGMENFFLGFLEVPHGVKGEYYYRRQEYLPSGIETFFIGLFKGTLNAAGRMGVGFYEVVTCPFPQKPILPEMKDWLY